MSKIAIIVGASSGIGLEVAKLLLADGWRLGVAARREEPLLELKALAPDCVEVKTIDVTSPDAGERLQSLIEQLGGMDLYFHASGIGKQNRTLDEDIELRTMETNAVGFTRMIGVAYRYFAERGTGHIAAITSIAGTKGLGPAPAYSATKALQATYLQSLEQQAHQRRKNDENHQKDFRRFQMQPPIVLKFPQIQKREQTGFINASAKKVLKRHGHDFEKSDRDGNRPDFPRERAFFQKSRRHDENGGDQRQKNSEKHSFFTLSPCM